MRISILLIGALTLGCTSATGPEARRTEAVIFPLDSRVADLTLPDSAAVGESFTVRVRSLGASSCWESAGEEVELTDSGATITVFDIDLQPEVGGCFPAIGTISHEVALRFDEPGVAEISIRGRERFGGKIVTVRREVVIEERAS